VCPHCGGERMVAAKRRNEVRACRRNYAHEPHTWGAGTEFDCPGTPEEVQRERDRRRLLLDAEILDAAIHVMRGRPGSPTDPVVFNALRARAEALRLEAGAT
jgi:hypothetical protein